MVFFDDYNVLKIKKVKKIFFLILFQVKILLKYIMCHNKKHTSSLAYLFGDMRYFFSSSIKLLEA
jgi:hypothetical protein